MPLKWNALTTKQIFFVMKMFMKGLKKDIFLILAICNFVKIKTAGRSKFIGSEQCYPFKKRFKKFFLSCEEIIMIKRKLYFLLQDSKLTKNPIPKFKMFLKSYYGPENNFYNITLREFIFAEMNFTSFVKSKELKYLNNIIATLWRKQVKPYKPNNVNYKGDRREHFNDFLLFKRSRKIRFLRKYKKMAIFTFYSGCRSSLQNEFPHIFSSDNGGGTKSTKNLATQMLALVRAVNSGDPTKNEKILDTNIREILGEIESAYEKIENIKK
jgi:hypothetical protein